VAVEANPKCSGNPKRYNGKMCATTTVYADYHKGACGCGPANGDNQVENNTVTSAYKEPAYKELLIITYTKYIVQNILQ